MTDEEKIVAIERAEPKPPDIHELGGGIYYTCFWLTCRETIYRWQNFCPRCGQKIDWEGATWTQLRGNLNR
jgi:hypothetical protein